MKNSEKNHSIRSINLVAFICVKCWFAQKPHWKKKQKSPKSLFCTNIFLLAGLNLLVQDKKQRRQ